MHVSMSPSSLGWFWTCFARWHCLDDYSPLFRRFPRPESHSELFERHHLGLVDKIALDRPFIIVSFFVKASMMAYGKIGNLINISRLPGCI